MKTALTIAGSDSSGGAGIQADIKTMTANGVFAMSAITALTAQNTTGVTAIFDTTPQFLAQQLDAVFTDIYPDAVKIGMVSSAPLIDTIAERLHFYGAKHIVVDPVMVATSGAKLLQDDAVQALTEKLLPLAEVLTPNIPEAEILSGMSIANAADMEAAARTQPAAAVPAEPGLPRQFLKIYCCCAASSCSASFCNKIVTVVPSPTRLAKVICVPNASAICAQSASPTPLPPLARARALSTR